MTTRFAVKGSHVTSPRESKPDRDLLRYARVMSTSEAKFLSELNSSTEIAHCTLFPEEGWLSDDNYQQAEAAQLCKGCPVFSSCESLMISDPQLPGVRAGVTEEQRKGWKAKK